MTRRRSVSGRHLSVFRRLATGAAALAGAVAAPVEALAAAGEGGGLIALNATLLVQVVNFLLLLLVLYRFVYRPLLETLEARSSQIKGRLAEAQAAREQAQRQLEEFQARLDAAQADAAAVRERALREAQATRERLTAEAEAEGARLVEAARQEIDQSVRRARAELRAEVGALAVEIAERLIQKSLREEDHQRLVDEALARMRPA